MGDEEARARCKGAIWWDVAAMSDAERELFDSLTPQQKAEYMGMGGNPRPTFDVPTFNSMTYERVLEKGNAFITLGLDRPGFDNSGFGGQYASHCAAIDIVAGRKAWFAHKKEKDGETPMVDNDFTIDAARIYLSQKADVDGYFRLPAGRVGSTTEESPRSTVALKADTVRMIARENIKLVTRTDMYNSQGGCLSNAVTRGYGIDLIAMRDVKSLQPMMRGENTRILLKAMLQLIQTVISEFTTYVSETRKFHKSVIEHTHMSPFYGSMTSPDFKETMSTGISVMINNITNTDIGTMSTKAAINQLILEYLEAKGVETIDANGLSKYILSPYNSNN